MTQHVRPLYVRVHIDGKLVKRMLINNEFAINVILMSMVSKLEK